MLNFAFSYKGEESKKIGWDRLIREACDLYGFRSSLDQIVEYLDEKVNEVWVQAHELLCQQIDMKKNKRVWALCFDSESHDAAVKFEVIEFLTAKILGEEPAKPLYGAARTKFEFKRIERWRQAVRAFEFHCAQIRAKTFTTDKGRISLVRRAYALECGVLYDCRTHRDVPDRNMIEPRRASDMKYAA
jgi:hypothetical protein